MTLWSGSLMLMTMPGPDAGEVPVRIPRVSSRSCADFSASALESTVRWYCEHRAWWEPLKSGEFLAFYERQYGHR